MIYERMSPFMLNEKEKEKNHNWARQSGPPNLILNILITQCHQGRKEKSVLICVGQKVKYFMS